MWWINPNKAVFWFDLSSNFDIYTFKGQMKGPYAF